MLWYKIKYLSDDCCMIVKLIFKLAENEHYTQIKFVKTDLLLW